MAKKAKLSGIMEVGRKALAAGQAKSELQMLLEGLANWRRPRGRPKGSTKIISDAVHDFEWLRTEMHERGYKSKHGLEKKIAALVVKGRRKKGLGAPHEDGLIFAARRHRAKLRAN